MSRRVFAAIDISDKACEAAIEYVSRLRSEFPNSPVRWERPEKLHVTVKFAGALDKTELAEFTERVLAASKSVEPFPIKIAGTGAFVKHRGPSVLWLGVEQVTGEDALGRIAAMLGHEGRPFHPHVTIARIKDVQKAKGLINRHRVMEFKGVEFDVNEIVIYESELLPTGSVYKSIGQFPLTISGGSIDFAR